MKVIISTNSYLVENGAHGSNIIARRHAEMLKRGGVEVLLICPADINSEGNDYKTYTFKKRAELRFSDQLPNAVAVMQIINIIQEFNADLVYDVHGPPWAVEAAWEKEIPAVSMIGDYSWFCQRVFFVDHNLQRCESPELRKCFNCLNAGYSRKRKVLHEMLGLWPLKFFLGKSDRMVSFNLKANMTDSFNYLKETRAKVTRFIVGDEQAWELLQLNGVEERLIARIEQGLPQHALVQYSSNKHIENKKLTLCFVGRLHPDKGFHVLAKAFEALDESIDIELWIVHKKFATQSHCEQFFEDKVIFNKFIEQGRIKLFRPDTSEALYALMAKADLGIIPSVQYEAPCLVMLEFVAQKTPIIRSVSKGMEHIIVDGVNGATFAYGNSEALKVQIIRVWEQPDLVSRWRNALPEIKPDSEYGRELVKLFYGLAK